MSVGDVVKLKLEGIASGGDAFAKLDGKTVFVAGGAPCEFALCRIMEEENTWSRAVLLEVIEPSLFRVDAQCSFFGKCGGCNLAHINYDAQLKLKTSILEDYLLRSGEYGSLEIEIFPSPPWEYRNRMQFHCLRQAKEGESFSFGLKGKGTNEVIAISDCPVAVPGIRAVLDLADSFSIPIDKDRFTVFAKDDVFLSEGGQERGKIKILGKEITLDAGVFFQSNCCMLEKLITELEKVAEIADKNLPMADFYSGVGTFASFLGGSFPKVFLAEENKCAIGLARENLRNNQSEAVCANAECFALRDIEWQRTIMQAKTKFGFAVVDPPRAGLNKKFALSLSLNGPEILAYVSCDVSSLVRDAKILISGGYRLREIKLFDFYPQTAHIESLAVFERS